MGVDVITSSPLSTRSPSLFFSEDTVGELELHWLAMVLFWASFVELEDMVSPLLPLWSLLAGGGWGHSAYAAVGRLVSYGGFGGNVYFGGFGGNNGVAAGCRV